MHNEVSGRLGTALRLKNRIDQLEYVRAMIRELRSMAGAERFDMIALHLEMAYLEASDTLRELHAKQDMLDPGGAKISDSVEGEEK